MTVTLNYCNINSRALHDYDVFELRHVLYTLWDVIDNDDVTGTILCDVSSAVLRLLGALGQIVACGPYSRSPPPPYFFLLSLSLLRPSPSLFPWPSLPVSSPSSHGPGYDPWDNFLHCGCSLMSLIESSKGDNLF